MQPVRVGEDVSIDAFAFSSEIWKQSMKNVIYFTDNLRQKDSPELFKILQEIRYNTMSNESFKSLCNRLLGKPNVDRKTANPPPICIYPRRKQVDEENKKVTDQLINDGKESHTFKRRMKYFNLSDSEKKFYYASAIKNMSVPETVTLCVDMPVILTVNYSDVLRNGCQVRYLNNPTC